ncbi:MAG: hypothetical protein IKU86_03830 [Thermoguttaceae bacterium]|nr:hypothetical protein [Thermoguttaceae bacterium]
MFSLLPSYSFEDFSLYRKSSEVDAIFSAWSALYHPALVAHFDAAPRWEPAGSPTLGLTPRLVVVPPCAESMLSPSWVKSAEESGAIFIRDVEDRDEILRVAFEKLEIDAPIGDEETETFLSLGLTCFLEELLTRKLRYMSNLDSQSFSSRVVDAARAHQAGNVEERETNLQKAFDLLTQAKEYFFPTATKLLELTWVEEEDFAAALPDALRLQRRRDEKSNVVLPVPLLKICRERYPETFALLKEEIEAKRTVLIGGDEWEGPLYLQSPLEIVRTLLAGRAAYLDAFETAPKIFARREAGYAQILPQLLKLTGYEAAFARTADGWTLLDKPTDRSRFLWQGRDGSTVAAFCKKPLDAAESEEILQLPERIGNSYYSDDATSIVFERRPGKGSRWLSDLFRMDRYSPAIGKFYDFNEYAEATRGAGDREKFVKDQFKTNFLTRSARRGRSDLVSNWPRRRRLGAILSALDGLEATVREATLKAKRDDATLNSLFSAYLDASKGLSARVAATLDALDARFLVPDVESLDENAENATTRTAQTADLDATFAELEAEKNATLDAAARFLAAASKSAKTDDSNGFLFVNTAATAQEIVWETRRSGDGETSQTAQPTQTADKESEKSLDDAAQRAEAAELGFQLRTFVGADGLRQHVATLPTTGSYWIPKTPGVEYRFLNRPVFETGALDPADFPAPELDETAEATAANSASADAPSKRKNSFFRQFAAKLRCGAADASVSDAATAAENGANDETAPRSALVEYVEQRYSAKEIERYYVLRNEYFEIKVDPTTGSVRRLTTFNVDAPVVSNGLLRHPSRGNRFAWDVALKLPGSLRRDDCRSTEDSGYGYTVSAADKISVLASGPAIGRLRVDGRLVAPNGEKAADFTQILTIRRESRIIEVDAEITPLISVDETPWESYYGVRFAWKDGLADLYGGVGATLIWTGRDYLQAPECVDVRSEENIGITVLSAGLPYFKRAGDTRLDAVLIPTGETRRRFRFGVGVDLDRPHRAALEFADVPPFALADVPRPKRLAATSFSSSEGAVQILERRAILNAAGDYVGTRLTALETVGAKTTTTFKAALPIERVEFVDFTDAETDKTLEAPSSSAFDVEFRPRQLRVMNVYFRRKSLR